MSTRSPSRSCAPAFTEFLEVLSGQSKAVEDLEVMLKEELQASHDLAEAAAGKVGLDSGTGVALQQFSSQVVEQGRVIDQLKDMVLALCKEIRSEGNVESSKDLTKQNDQLVTRIV